MNIRHLAAAVAAGLAGAALASPASALSLKECSAKYQAAKTAKTLNGQSWNDFQRLQCNEEAPKADAKPAAGAAKEATKADAKPAAAAAKEAAKADAKPSATTTAPAAPAKEAQAPAPKTDVKPAPATTPPPAAAAAPAAKGLTSKECSAKYKADKAANALGGLKWNDYRKQKCGIEPAAKKSAAVAPAATGPAVFPTAVAAKYSTEKPGKARMHTCLDQYRANKATGGNGGLTWISRKGGGYYSQCNKKLKGQG